MSLTDITNTAFTTSLQNDKVLGEPITGSFSVGASSIPGSLGNVATNTVAQSFGEDVLPIMIFSTDDTSWQEAGTRIFTAGATLVPNFAGSCYTTATDIIVVGQNFTGGALTCYYKVVLISET